MKYKKIVLAGGSGYLGKVLAGFYKDKAEEVIILSRKPHLQKGNVRTLIWDAINEGNWIKDIDGADLLVNLCGKNVNCRYNGKNKREILESRLLPTALLGRVIAHLEHPPKLWINITSATIYRHAEDRPQDEETGELGTGFSVEVCKKWEETFFATNTPNTRKVALRMGIVLGMSDSAFPRLLNLVKFGLGGKQGNGNQYMSWVHELDAAECTEFLLNHNELSGAVNCTAPVPVKNSVFMGIIRKICKMPFGLPAPAWLLKIGALIIGTETELILKSRWVLPKRLTDAGYKFLFPQPNEAISDLINNKTT